jgi:hypothetical protein
VAETLPPELAPLTVWDAICQTRVTLTEAYSNATSALVIATERLSAASLSLDGTTTEELFKVVQITRGVAADARLAVEQHRHRHRC